MFYIKKLNKALERFESDEYGQCTDCDCDIKYERLLARPTAELCITCKDEAEKEEQGNFVARQSKTYAPAPSLVGAKCGSRSSSASLKALFMNSIHSFKKTE